MGFGSRDGSNTDGDQLGLALVCIYPEISI